jgi:hypothetical protein
VKSTHCRGFAVKSTHCGGFTAKSTHCGGFQREIYALRRFRSQIYALRRFHCKLYALRRFHCKIYALSFTIKSTQQHYGGCTIKSIYVNAEIIIEKNAYAVQRLGRNINNAVRTLKNIIFAVRRLHNKKNAHCGGYLSVHTRNSRPTLATTTQQRGQDDTLLR